MTDKLSQDFQNRLKQIVNKYGDKEMSELAQSRIRKALKRLFYQIYPPSIIKAYKMIIDFDLVTKECSVVFKLKGEK